MIQYSGRVTVGRHRKNDGRGHRQITYLQSESDFESYSGVGLVLKLVETVNGCDIILLRLLTAKERYLYNLAYPPWLPGVSISLTTTEIVY